MNHWEKVSEKAYEKVRKEHPVTKDTPTMVNVETGKVVNMSRVAMLARVEALRQGVSDTVCGN